MSESLWSISRSIEPISRSVRVRSWLRVLIWRVMERTRCWAVDLSFLIELSFFSSSASSFSSCSMMRRCSAMRAFSSADCDCAYEAEDATKSTPSTTINMRSNFFIYSVQALLLPTVSLSCCPQFGPLFGPFTQPLTPPLGPLCRSLIWPYAALYAWGRHPPRVPCANRSRP